MSVSAHDGGGGGATRSGLIIPENIPGDDLVPVTLEIVAGTLRTAGSSALAQAGVAESSWSGLPAVVESPQGPVIYAALGTPSAAAAAIERKFDRVADALEEFASAVRPIKSTFADIKADAVAFRATIRADERVWVLPRETHEYQFDAQAQSTAGMGVYRTTDEIVAYLHGRGEATRVSGGQVKILAHWTQSSEHIDKNNALMDRLADAYARLQNAEADCATAINRQRDVCVAEVEKIEAWQLKQSGENTVVLPWGSRVDEDRNCGESWWWGIGNAGKEGVEGFGGLFGYNSLIDGWSWDKSWETAGQAWAGLFTAVGALAVMTFPPSALLGQLGVPVFKEANDLTTGMVKGILAWDTWAENPAEAAGRVLVNVGSMFIPGAGQVGAAIKGLTSASHIVDLATDAARHADSALTGSNRLAELMAKFDGFTFDGLGALRMGDDLVPAGGRLDLPDGDSLHVGAKAPDAPPTPVSLLDDSTPSPKPHSDSDSGPVAPAAADPDNAPAAPDTAPDGGSGGGNVPSHSGLDAPPPHAGPDGTPLSSSALSEINTEFRDPKTNAVDPARFDEWAASVSEAYPTLTPDDIKGIYDYTTDSGYRPMNEYLRFGTINEGMAPTAAQAQAQALALEARITATTEALAKLPAQPGVGYRGVGFTDDFLAQFEVGAPWSDSAFSSSSTNPGVAYQFALEEAADGKVPGIIEVQGLTGSGVTPISRYPTEAEVLYQRNTPYEVVSKYQDENGFWRITLREVPQP